MGLFDNAKSVVINGKEVKSIKTSNGGVLYELVNKFHWESDAIYDSDNPFPTLIWEVPVNFRASFKLSTTKLMYFMTESNYFEFGGFDYGDKKTIIIGGIDQDFSIVVDDNGTKTKLSSYGDLAKMGGVAMQTGLTVNLTYVDGLITVTIPNFDSISAEYILEDRTYLNFVIGDKSSISEVTIDGI